MNCRIAEQKLMDLLSPAAENSAEQATVAAHVAGCTPCAAQLDELRATMAALDSWTAPEISPWFDGKMAARLREEAERQPEGFFERLRSRLLFNTGRAFKPALSGAMVLVMLIAGGTFSFQKFHQSQQPAPVSIAVQDLQRLDNDAVALQEMDQMATDGNDDGGNSPS